MKLQQSIVDATQQAGAISATQAAAAAATQGEAVSRTWTVAGWTATSAAQATAHAQVWVTQTERARGTATAAYAPFMSATRMALEAKVEADQRRAAVGKQLEPYKQAFPMVAGLFLMLIVYSVVRYILKLFTWRIVGQEPDYDEPAATRAAIDTTAYLVPNNAEGTDFSRIFLDIDERSLWMLANGLAKGIPFSELRWKAFPKFRQVQDAFLRQGLAEWKDRTTPQQGVTLTATGREFIERVLQRPTSQ